MGFCGECGVQLSKPVDGIECAKCSCIYHIKCSKINTEALRAVRSSADNSILWACSSCRCSSMNVSLVSLQKGLERNNSEMLQQFKDLSLKFEAVVENLRTRFTAFEDEISSELVTLKSEQKRLDKFISEFQRREKLCDIIINGIPDSPNINIKDTIFKLLELIGISCDNSNISVMFRLKKNGAILVKFASKTFRDEVMGKYFGKGNLNLLEVLPVLEIDKRVYFNDNLLPSDAAIAKKCSILKKRKLIFAYSSRNGHVCVKVNGRDKYVTISSLEHLSSLASEPESQFQDSSSASVSESRNTELGNTASTNKREVLRSHRN